MTCSGLPGCCLACRCRRRRCRYGLRAPLSSSLGASQVYYVQIQVVECVGCLFFFLPIHARLLGFGGACLIFAVSRVNATLAERRGGCFAGIGRREWKFVLGVREVPQRTIDNSLAYDYRWVPVQTAARVGSWTPKTIIHPALLSLQQTVGWIARNEGSVRRLSWISWIWR